MDIFGPVWDGYLDIIEKDWEDKVTENAVASVKLCGGFFVFKQKSC